jgi:hypothetical protein
MTMKVQSRIAIAVLATKLAEAAGNQDVADRNRKLLEVYQARQLAKEAGKDGPR